jgi:hypothetical protein
VALLAQAKRKPALALQLRSSVVTTPASSASEERGDSLPPKLGVSATRSVHGAHARPSPAVPTGQAPQVDADAHATPV